MAFVGPLTSLVIAAILYAAFLAVPRGTGLWEVRFGLAFTSYLSLTLGVFNLPPAFPMDGGRVLGTISRADIERALRLAELQPSATERSSLRKRMA